MKEADRKKEQVKEQFSRNASEYVTSSTHAKGDDLELLVAWLGPKSDWKALDVATGGGHVAKQLAAHVSTLFAADLTRPMLEAARDFIRPHRDNVEFVVSDAEELPFLDGIFDAVTCRIAAHHFPHPEKFVQEAARVLKPGGKLLLIDNVAPEEEALDLFVNKLELLRDESHVRCSKVSEWSHWLAEAGLRQVNARLRKKTFDYPAWVRRTARNEKQVQQVDAHILTADEALRAYIGLVLTDGAIARIQIDEWMMLAVKEIGHS